MSPVTGHRFGRDNLLMERENGGLISGAAEHHQQSLYFVRHPNFAGPQRKNLIVSRKLVSFRSQHSGDALSYHYRLALRTCNTGASV